MLLGDELFRMLVVDNEYRKYDVVCRLSKALGSCYLASSSSNQCIPVW